MCITIVSICYSTASLSYHCFYCISMIQTYASVICYRKVYKFYRIVSYQYAIRVRLCRISVLGQWLYHICVVQECASVIYLLSCCVSVVTMAQDSLCRINMLYGCLYCVDMLQDWVSVVRKCYMFISLSYVIGLSRCRKKKRQMIAACRKSFATGLYRFSSNMLQYCTFNVIILQDSAPVISITSIYYRTMSFY